VGPTPRPIEETIIRFDRMYGVDGPFMNYEVRGIPGDELPWEVGAVRGRLTSDGHLQIMVRGLVFPDDESVPADKRGINDEAEFRAVVSCLAASEDDSTVRVVNVVTKGFPATVEGDANINARVVLPEDCVAPIVFIVGGDEMKSFAITGAGG
jgi:hypothetical protein